MSRPDADRTDLTIPGGPTENVSIRIVKPKGNTQTRPVVLYTHCACWASATPAPSTARSASSPCAPRRRVYSLSPEARYLMMLSHPKEVADLVREVIRAIGI